MTGADGRPARTGGWTAHGAASLLHRVLSPVLLRRRGGVLTVLAYHRVADLAAAAGTYLPNVSATPAGFAAQLDFLCRRYDAVGAAQLVAWVEGRGPLPPRPLLITFDDGYRDNYEVAFPLLRARSLPAVIFLATDAVGREEPFLGDRAAWLFAATARRDALLPLLGHCRWATAAERQAVLKKWLERLKSLPDAERRGAVGRLADALAVAPSPGQPGGLLLTWAQVREMAAQGIAPGGHTRTHPILTRVTPAAAEDEIRSCRERIERETGCPVRTFAYPNGQPGDFSASTAEALRRHGFAAAFTLVPGPARCSDARSQPLAIRRIAISHKDGPLRFVLKLLGAARLRGAPATAAA